ncbi:MAG: M23 family metallopeptidase, partial [Opitutales bacterium]
MSPFVIRLTLMLLLGTGVLRAAGLENLVWPTPNPAFMRGEPIEAFVQPTVSGDPESGLFGCVRNDGSRFHEGLDLFPLYRDGRGEARDPVYAILPGRIVHINTSAGLSSYGRYVVVMHDR